MTSTISILTQQRRLIIGAVKDLSQEQWFAIPNGFNNNVAWNIGHIIMVQQAFAYRLTGQETLISDEMTKMYSPGSSPADWSGQPDSAELLTMLHEHPIQTQADYDAGKLTEKFHTYTTSTGVTLTNVEESMVFNNFHEGLHLGTILALKDFM